MACSSLVTSELVWPRFRPNDGIRSMSRPSAWAGVRRTSVAVTVRLPPSGVRASVPVIITGRPGLLAAFEVVIVKTELKPEADALIGLKAPTVLGGRPTSDKPMEGNPCNEEAGVRAMVINQEFEPVVRTCKLGGAAVTEKS